MNAGMIGMIGSLVIIIAVGIAGFLWKDPKEEDKENDTGDAKPGTPKVSNMKTH
jgi:hypothetical protein